MGYNEKKNPHHNKENPLMTIRLSATTTLIIFTVLLLIAHRIGTFIAEAMPF